MRRQAGGLPSDSTTYQRAGYCSAVSGSSQRVQSQTSSTEYEVM